MSIAITSALDDITNGQSRPSRLQYLTVVRDNAIARKSRFVEGLDRSHDDDSALTTAPTRPSFGHARADSACFAEDFLPGERGPSHHSEAELLESQSIIEDVTFGGYPRITVEDRSTDETPFDNIDIDSNRDTVTPLGWWDFDLDLDDDFDLDRAEEDIYDSEFGQEVVAAVSDDEDDNTDIRTPPYTTGRRLETILEQSSIATSQTSPSRSEAASERMPLLPLSVRRVLQKSKSFPIRNVLTKKRKRWGVTKSMDDEQLTTNRDRQKAESSSRSSISSQASTCVHDDSSDHDVRHATLNVPRARSSASSEAHQTLRRTSSRLKEIFHRLVSSSQRSEERVAAQAKQYRVVSLPEGLSSCTNPVVSRPRSASLGHVHQEDKETRRIVSESDTTLTSDELMDVLIHGSPLHSLHASRRYCEVQQSHEPTELDDFSPTSTIHRGGAARELTLSGDDGPLTPQPGSPLLLTPSPLKIQRVGSWARRSLDSDYVSRTFSGYSLLGKFPAPPAEGVSEWDRATSGGTWPRGSAGRCTSAGVSTHRPDAPSLRSLDAAAEATATFSIAASDSTTSLVCGTPLDKLHAHLVDGSDTVDDPFISQANEPAAEPITPTPADRLGVPALPSPTPTPSPISVPSPLRIRRPVKLKDYAPFPAPPVSARPAKARSMLRSFSSTLNLSIRGGRGASSASTVSRQVERPRHERMSNMNPHGAPATFPLDAMTTSGVFVPQELDNQPPPRGCGVFDFLKFLMCGVNVEVNGDAGSASSSRRSGLATRNKIRKSRTGQPNSPPQMRPAHRVAHRSWWACANCMGGGGFNSQGDEMGRGRPRVMRSDESYRTMASDLPPARLVSAERLNWFRAT